MNEQLAVNAIRILSADAVQKAKSGHPGLPLGAAPIAYELWAHHMKHNPKDPNYLVSGTRVFYVIFPAPSVWIWES